MRLDCAGLDLSLSAYLDTDRLYISLNVGLSLFNWSLLVRWSEWRLHICVGPFWLLLDWDFGPREKVEAWLAKYFEHYEPGTGISVLDTHERMRREGKL